ncbi:thiamine-phosphate kinase [Hydrogenimonas sp.]
MNKEAYFIHLFADSDTIGDDAAILKDMNRFCVSQDAFFEGVHFRREWMSFYTIGYKAMVVNVSDAVAMNATPRYALVTAALPRDLSLRQMEELARGLKEAAARYGVAIVGGDTIANTKLDLSITILAECPRPLGRTGLKPGDLLAYTGRLGGSAAGLRRLMRGGSLGPGSRFLAPTLRTDFIRRAARHLRVGMDISDGLFDDLHKLAILNHLGFRFLRSIPKRVGCSGEEYEMLVGFDPRHEKALRRLAEATRTPLTIFAQAARTPFTNPCKPHHFA